MQRRPFTNWQIFDQSAAVISVLKASAIGFSLSRLVPDSIFGHQGPDLASDCITIAANVTVAAERRQNLLVA